MKSIREFLNRKSSETSERDSLENEGKEFETPSEILPQTLKVIFFAGLAFLNYRLFSKTVPGIWGHITGIVAVMGEAIALYCTHNFSRASGAFRVALGIFGFFLMVFAIVHSTFSFLDMVGVSQISETVHAYARVYAFPLLASLLGVAVVMICMTHPKNKIRLAQAKAHTDMVTERARAASQLSLMKADSVLSKAELERHQEKNKYERELLNTLKSLIHTEQEKVELIASIPNKPLREKLAAEFGIDLSAQPPPQSASEAEPRGTLPN